MQSPGDIRRIRIYPHRQHLPLRQTLRHIYLLMHVKGSLNDPGSIGLTGHTDVDEDLFGMNKSGIREHSGSDVLVSTGKIFCRQCLCLCLTYMSQFGFVHTRNIHEKPSAVVCETAIFFYNEYSMEDYSMNMDALRRTDPEIAETIDREYRRQNSHLELIASENWVSEAVMEAQGSIMTNKYAEGYPAKRYYGGCENVDTAEDLARDRAKKLFHAAYVNVQPHSGAQANMAVEFTLLKPGDTILGMDLNAGGHLTHGSPVNYSGTYFHAVSYGVNSDGYIDDDEVERLALQYKPKLIIAGASAYPRKINFERFRRTADLTGAYLMVDMAHVAGLVAAGLFPDPLPYADVVTTTTHKTLRGPRGGMILVSQEALERHPELRAANGNIIFDKAVFPGIQGGPLMHVIAAKAVCFKEALSEEFRIYQQNIVNNAQALARGLLNRDIDLVSGGTDCHLLLVDLRRYERTGKEIEKLLDQAGITANKNGIPNDPRGPMVTSGVRLGTPAVTTRGLGTEDMDRIAEAIALIIREGEEGVPKAADIVRELTEKYPLH